MKILFIDGHCGLGLSRILEILKDQDWHDLALINEPEPQEKTFQFETRETFRRQLEYRSSKGKCKRRGKDWYKRKY